MVSATRAAHNIEVTAESLREDLARLEVQKQALERELAAVVAHLGSIQRALSALAVLIDGPAPVEALSLEGAAEPATPQPPEGEPRARQPKRRTDSGGRTSRPSRASRASRAESEQRGYGRLTEQIMEYLAGVGDADVRARDVAAALGRDTDSGSINAVRSTLDRLVGTSRIRRTGRGLYRAQQS